MSANIKSLNEICLHYGVAILYSFGSRAGEVAGLIEGMLSQLPESDSDIDIGIKFAEKIPSVRQKIALASDLEDFFRCRRVDLVLLEEADPFLALEIVRGTRLFALDEREADEYDLFVLRRAGDLIPLERERAALVMGERS